MKFSVKRAVVLSAASLVMFTSCRDEEKDNKLQAPTKYEFSRNNESSVSISGQHYRIDMHSQVKGYANSGKDMAITATHLSNLVKNEGNLFTDGAFYSASDLNGTSKQIWNKLGASPSANQSKVHTYFNDLFADLEALSAHRTATAANGVAGMAGNRLVDAKGIEVIQLMSKSMMGALELDQIVNYYLSDAKLNVDNTNIPDGKNYTAMEHHWDEAFGYTGLPMDPSIDITQGDNKKKYKRFWSGYIKSVDGSVAGSGIKQKIYDAFLKGRTAIINNDMVARDAQRDEVIKLMEKVCFIKCVYYLRKGALALQALPDNATAADKASAFHGISEGLGFLYAINFTPKGQGLPSNHNATHYLNEITTMGLHSDQAPTKLLQVAQKLAELGGFNKEDA